ncbi:MAG: tetratricopeptide repeat protein [Acidobacteriota bacterium]
MRLRPHRSGSVFGRLGRAASTGWAAVVLVALALAPLQVTATESLGGLELTAPVRHQLWQLQESWQGWTRAWAANDADAASAQLEQMQSISKHLGMERLPDLSAAAAAYAVRAAQSDDFPRARWSLDTARQLDSDRPETLFARSTVQRLEGNYLGAVGSVVRGILQISKMPLERSLWLHNLGLWVLYTVLLSGGLFVALMMGTKGGSLFYDLARLLSPPLQRTLADVLTVLLLVWPIVLPSGLMWLALYWSILLWGYGSSSERGVLILLWLVLGATPTVLTLQQRSAQMALVPPARLIDNLGAGRLYGTLFSDLEVLNTMVPDSATVTEIVADLHRRLGQWEQARAIYTELSQDPEQGERYTATAYCNIGVFHHRNGDYETAVNYFRRAAEADPRLAEAFYNLGQAYALLYDFNNQHQAMARAKELDADRVERWNAPDLTAEESAVAVDGGLLRAPELREQLESLWSARDQRSVLSGLWYRYRALTVVFAALILALVLHQLRRQVGYRSRRLAPPSLGLEDNRWARALIPGLGSAAEDRGILAFFGLLIPVGLVLISLMGMLGYRMPVAVDPGRWLAFTCTALGLLLLILLRLVMALSRD